MPGGELFARLRAAARLANDAAKFYAAEITCALKYLHDQDIAYRDLKPENVCLDAQGHVRLTDFGFAKRVKTRTYTLCGTPDYLAPEIIQSRGHGKAVDAWALGIMLFEMLQGRPPFEGSSPFDTYRRVLIGSIEWSTTHSVHLAAKDMVRRLLTADPARRLGCGHSGMQAVQEHAWFAGVDWDEVESMGIPAPWVPVLSSEADTRNFDTFSELSHAERLASQRPLTGPQARLFEDLEEF